MGFSGCYSAFGRVYLSGKKTEEVFQWRDFLFWRFFFLRPVIFLILFLVRLCRYIAAKRKNKAVPGSVPEETVLTHRTLMIVFLVFTIVFSAIVLGVMVLLSREIAYM